jgi:hypothetical protein
MQKGDSLYGRLLCDWFISNRRELLKLGLAELALSVAAFNRAYADAEFPIEVSQQGGQKQNDSKEASKNKADPKPEKEKVDYKKDDAPIEVKLGSSFRAPTCGSQSLSSTQFKATNTPEKAPEKSSVPPGSYFSDSSSRRFLGQGETPMETAWRGAADRPSVSEEPARVQDLFVSYGVGLLLQLAIYNASITGSRVANSIDWSELGSAAGEKSVDVILGYVKDELVERIVPKAFPIYNFVSFVTDVFEVTPLNGGKAEELTFLDRMSPSERREWWSTFFERERLHLDNLKNLKEIPLPEPALEAVRP